MQHTNKLLLTSAIALTLAACSGDGSSNRGYPTSSGLAVDGPLEGSTVTCDLNSNGVVDAGEPRTLTAADGRFTFVPACYGQILVSGGSNNVSATESYPFTGALKSPAGSKIVSPLTTMLAESGMSQEQLAGLLGLPADTDILNADPTKDVNLYKATVAIQQIIQQVSNAMGATAGDITVVTKVAGYLATALENTSSTTPLFNVQTGALDTTVLGTVLSSVVSDVENDTDLNLLDGLSGGDETDLLNELTTNLNNVVTATDTSTLESVAVITLDPEATTTVRSVAERRYVYLKNDAFKINGNEITLSDFQTNNAAAVAGPITTIGFDFELTEAGVPNAFNTGQPAIDQNIEMIFYAAESSRALNMYLTGVHVTNNAGQIEATVPASARAYVYANTGSKTVTLVLNNLAANTISVNANNEVSLNYSEIVDRVKNSQTVIDAGVQSEVQSLLSLEGNFTVLMAFSNLNLRYEDATPLYTHDFNSGLGTYYEPFMFTNPDTLQQVALPIAYYSIGFLTINPAP
ncbi:MAG TPA: hypothetical protein VIN71_00095 [Pseudomonadales bacterium]